jgi:type VI protein secretion system component Hcp
VGKSHVCLLLCSGRFLVVSEAVCIMGWSQLYLDIKFARAGRVLGECEYGGFENQIVLLDFDWSLGVAKDTPRRNADPIRKPKFDQLRLTKRFDASSIPLLGCLSTRDTIESACITVAHAVGNSPGQGMRKAMEVKVVSARLESLTLNMSNQGKSIVVQEDITISYSTIYVKRYVMGPDGQYTNTAKTYQSKAANAIGLN